MPINDPEVRRRIRNSTIKDACNKLVYNACVFAAGAALVYFVSARPHEQSYWKMHKEYMELSETNSVLRMDNTILRRELDSIIENSKEQKKDSSRTYEDQEKSKRQPQEPQTNPELLKEKKEIPSIELDDNKIARNNNYFVLENKLK